MREQLIFTTIIVFLVGVIVLLGAILLQPVPQPRQIDFEYLMELTGELRDELKEVNITYLVNISLENETVVGEMNFYKNETDKKVTLSPEVRDYEGYGILMTPEVLIRTIQENTRKEYSGELFNEELQEECWSTITEPNSTNYQKIINGEYLFVTCFDKNTGYPSLTYSSELKGEEVIYSKVSITNITYSA